MLKQKEVAKTGEWSEAGSTGESGRKQSQKGSLNAIKERRILTLLVIMLKQENG